jgi:hypothetical protein
MSTMRLITTSLPLSLLAFSLLAQENNGRPESTPDVKHDVSPPLREMHIPPRSDAPREKPLRTIPQGPGSNQPDPVLQTAAGPLVSATNGLNFPGVGNGDYSFVPDAAPPDTEGVVGATQYVQWVNESFAVFDKKTGAIVLGFPKPGNTLWSGFGGGCETNNDGDPIVQYDKLANRWIFTQFSVSTTPYLQCVAVSKTSDATGEYYRYAFNYGNTQFPDYPKLGVWPDAYYISFNIFNNGTSFAGAKVCAYDRASMLLGNAATQQCFQLSTSYGGLLPSDLDGATQPPAGSPNYFLNFGSNSLNLWKFHVDWGNPANTTLTGPTSIPVASFTAACNGGTCIPQAGTRQKLDSLADRLMYRLAYRNFGNHEALVVNHSVATINGNVGVRWYELRNPGGAPTVFQQGTFAPDSSSRWMGSIAMDQSGNIALGYSVSSSAMHPAIRFTGRAASDPLGSMQAESSIVEGTGSQTANLSRWGDYSAMTVDPVDDCTFWYTNEYLKTSGTFNWSTQIASFTLAGCGPAATPDFSLSASPSSQTVTQGGPATSTISINGVNNYSGTVNLSVAAGTCPSNATCTLNPTSGKAGQTSALTVATTAMTTPGTYQITVNGGDGTLNHSTTFAVTVPPAASNLAVTVSPSSIMVSRKSSNTATVTVSGNSSSASLSVSGVPSKITATFSPTSVAAGGGSSTLTVSANPAASVGSFTLTITATSGGASVSQPLNVTVN